MATIGNHSWQESLKVRDAVREVLRECTTLETATQRLAEVLFAEFEESIVLVRCFVTVPYAALPTANQKFVDTLAREKDITAEITDEVPVLSLLGTSGVQDAWNDRRLSKGHIGIPLVSVSFVESIPMIARLLKELDVKLEWLSNVESTGLSEKELAGGWIGTFYVREAATATDYQGRFIIPAQDFVAENQIKTVFGLGGIYPQGNLFTLVVFTRDIIEKDSLAEFTPLIPLIAANTSHLIKTGEIFL
ncbi:MAG TPA: hypothetical protein VGB77_03720 [Abditibacteriaceae bacterium]